LERREFGVAATPFSEPVDVVPIIENQRTGRFLRVSSSSAG
jgi:hypothetical protein